MSLQKQGVGYPPPVHVSKGVNTYMKNILKDSLKLIAISFVCNWCLFIPYMIYCFFETPGMPYNVDGGIVIGVVCMIFEVIMFSIIGSNMKFSYKSLAIFFIVSILFSILSTALRGGWSSVMLLNAVVISYTSFAKSLIAPICETTLKAFVLLISSLIARRQHS